MKKIFSFLLFFIYFNCSLFSFEKVIIWGHKLHTHTHSYIHNAFFITFKHLGYKTYWFDDNDDVSHFDFANSLFLTEGQVDKKIPLRNDCQYILHNCYSSKYKPFFEKGLCITLQVYTDRCLNNPLCQKVAPCIYYNIPGKTVYMPWATDLLPHEINQMKQKLPHIRKTNKVFWIGTKGGGQFGNIEELNPFIRACRENRIIFIHKDPWSKGISVEENMHLTAISYLSPAIVGHWQRDQGYIPCRIFKNISYGQLGLTNSLRVFELFQDQIIYNPDTYQLFYDAKAVLEKNPQPYIEQLMDFVRDNHTYINRIKILLDFLEIVKNQ